MYSRLRHQNLLEQYLKNLYNFASVYKHRHPAEDDLKKYCRNVHYIYIN